MTKSLISPLLFFVVLVFSSTTSAQNLERKITLDAKDQTLQEILETISEKSHVSFSYMNNELPDEKLNVHFQEETLKEVLTSLLKNTTLDFVEHGQQIIIRRNLSKPLIPEVQPAEKEEKVSDEKISIVVNSKDTLIIDSSKVKKPVSKPLTEEPEQPDSLVLNVDNSDMLTSMDSSGTDQTDISREEKIQVTGIDQQPAVQEQDGHPPVIPAGDTLVSLPKDIWYHFGLFFPISTNGYDAKQYSNKLSLHALAGYSGGLQGFEFSTMANIVNGHVNGMQLTAITNVVTGDMTGAQFSGVVNSVHGKAKGLQVAGVTNFVGKDHHGAQFSMATNVATGKTSGFQAAGVLNIAKHHSRFGQISGGVNLARDVNGPQIASLININNGQQNGLQIAGFMNQAGDINGAQFAAFMNEATHVTGLQAAGFINVAKKVKGAQIGVINVTDYMEGVPIGLLSVVKRNGYYDLELFYAEDFHANTIIKIGAPHFHNLFGLSYETDYKNRWAYGYGFGSQWGKNGFRVNTDVITYYVVEEKFPDGGFQNFELNLLSKFRLLGSLHYGNFGVFGGPVYNIMVSRHKDAESAVVGSDIAPEESLFDRTNRFGTNVKMWIGYNVGIRF